MICCRELILYEISSTICFITFYASLNYRLFRIATCKTTLIFYQISPVRNGFWYRVDIIIREFYSSVSELLVSLAG